MEKVLKVIQSFIGYLEKKSNKDLDDKTKNAGNKNYTCFARDYKKYTGANLQGQAWCAMFISVCFVIAYGLEMAKKLLCGSLYAYCPYGMAAFNKKKQLYTKPKKGDIIFFLRNGVAYHTGYVYKVSGNTVYTIEGNTSGASGVIPNGGGVCKKSYTVNSNMRFGRPDYALVNDADKTSQKAKTATKKSTSNDTKDELIKSLQKAVNDTVDGIAGAKTLAALPMLQKGSKGEVVEIMQRLIGDVHKISVSGGYDGDFGSGTLAAVKKFQKEKGLTVDGIVGAKTWKALLQ